MEKRYIDLPTAQMTDAAKVFDEAIVKSRTYKTAEFNPNDSSQIKQAIENIEDLAFAFVNGGIDPKDGRFLSPSEMTDAITALSDSGIGPSSVITQTIITRAVQMIPEPDSIWEKFSKRVSYTSGTQLVTPYIGSAHAARMIGVGQEYPIISIDENQETITSTGKYGVAIEFAEETIKGANYDIVSLFMQKAIEDLARLKNTEAVNLLLTKGIKLFDNLDPTNAKLGATTGKSLKTAADNGTINLRDLFNAIMWGVRAGVLYDTMLMSTFGYMVFMNEPVLRDFIAANGGPIFQKPQGRVGTERTVARGNAQTEGTGAFNRLTYSVPAELMNVNFQFIVTPYVPTYQKGDKVLRSLPFENVKPVPYKILTGVNAGQDVVCGDNMMTDLVLIDSTNALLYLEEEKISSDKIEDKLIDVVRIKFKERYKFVMMERGRGVGLIKNITIDPDTFDYYNTARPTVTEARAALN